MNSIINLLPKEAVIQYCGDGIFAIQFSKFLYSGYDKYCNYNIVNQSDMINIDFHEEYIIYRHGQFYLYKYGTLDSNYFVRCAQGSENMYHIGVSKKSDYELYFTEIYKEIWSKLYEERNKKLDDKFSKTKKSKKIKHKSYPRDKIINIVEKYLIPDLANIVMEYHEFSFSYLQSLIKEIYKIKKERRTKRNRYIRIATYPYQKNEVCEGIDPLGDDKVNINHPIYKILIEPYLNRELVESSSDTVNFPLNIEQQYKFNVFYFMYKNNSWENINYNFNLAYLHVYLIVSGGKIYLCMKQKGKKKGIIYRYLEDAYAYCCGSGNIFFYKMSRKKELSYSLEKIKEIKHIRRCEVCKKKLPKWVIDDKGTYCGYKYCNKTKT